MVTEYIRILNCNYERIMLEEKLDEKRYQYCMINRGGIRNLLPCFIRCIDDNSYLYYDISSKQNLSQIFGRKKIKREWMRHFLTDMKQMYHELDRFLLDGQCIIWNPEQIYQDLEKDEFCFFYIPYYQKNTGFKQLLEFWVENIDYEDDRLVEFVYHIHGEYGVQGNQYLEKQIFEDGKKLNEAELPNQIGNMRIAKEINDNLKKTNENVENIEQSSPKEGLQESSDAIHGFRNFWGNKKKQKKLREYYQNEIKDSIVEAAVSEDMVYTLKEELEDATEQECGKTVFIKETQNSQMRRLLNLNGEVAVIFENFPYTIGKKKEESDFVISKKSVSRIHARVTQEGNSLYLEDLNSTNGTFKNGLRMNPYEKKKLEKDDEIRFGMEEYIFK